MLTVIGRGKDAKLLATCLNCKLNNTKADIFIRYGFRRYWKIHPKLTINNIKALEVAGDKFYSLFLFKEAGLPVPKSSTMASDLSFPMLGRRFKHSKGRDIIFIKKPSDMKKCDYYVEFLQVQEEYRFHVIGDKVISVGIKLGGNKDSYCRNLDSGWTFKESTWRWKRIKTRMDVIAIKAVQVLGLDFGAIDIIVSDGKPYILEVNTAMGLIERRAMLYANGILEYITSKK